MKKIRKAFEFIWQTLYSKSISTRHDGSWHAKEKKKNTKDNGSVSRDTWQILVDIISIIPKGGS